MFAWVVIRDDNAGVVQAAVSRAWEGSPGRLATIARIAIGEHPILMIVPAGGRARRAPHWPDVLGDWQDINEEPLFPNAEQPVLAEEVSGLGLPALCAHAGPGFAAGSVAWYERGALISYEHVGSSSVAWDPDDGLGRPFDGTAASIAALGGKRVAKLFGSDATVDVLERQQLANRAVGGVLLRRAFHRMLGAAPPDLDDLAGMVATAPTLSL
ncbi:MAG TPA: hypothetical protein VGG74_22365 [Kofleriaceae bacterium]|jgi:hypothetical protein